MEPDVRSPDRLRRARVAFARVLQLGGWPGVAGVLLLAIAASIGHDASTRGELDARQVRAGVLPPPPLVAVARPAASAVPAIKLPASDDVPILLKRIERAAIDNRLQWSAADYRFVAATDQLPPGVEVRYSLKGPYPSLRASVVEVLGIAPAVTFREMAFSRSAVTAADVDGKFALLVFLADESSPTGPARSSR